MKIKIYILFLFVGALGSCKKSWIEEKSDKSLAIPKTIGDFQALMDNTSTTLNGAVPINMNVGGTLAEISSGDFLISNANYTTLNNGTALRSFTASTYLWNSDIYKAYASASDWEYSFQRIYIMNVVLKGIEKVNPNDTEIASWKNVKGSALFYRSLDFYNLLQQFAKPFDNSTARSDLGIPLRLDPDFNIVSKRASVQDGYNLVIQDLLTAKDILPVKALFLTRPSKPAAFALLARTCLAMEDYIGAKKYADSTLKYYNTLLDFKTLSTTATNPISRFNPEVLYHCSTADYTIFGPSYFNVEPSLLALYEGNDLRKSIFYRQNANGNMNLKGTYLGIGYPEFSGLATDEIYLIRAECNARANNINGALDDLNTLLRNRYNSSFVSLSLSTQDAVLARVIEERRKELCFRGGIRWTDLRRLNKDPRFAVVLTRVINSQTYTLPPNDKRYVFPIPNAEILTSGIEQNLR